jgi:hypothetical protein
MIARDGQVRCGALKATLLEFCLSDLLMQCYSLPHTASGRIGLLRGGNTNAFANFKARRTNVP